MNGKPDARKPTRRCAGHGTPAGDERRRLFVDAYLTNGRNQTQAAIACGLSPISASRLAVRYMRHPDVIAAIAVRSAELNAKFNLSIERTLQEVARIAYADPRKFFRADGSLIPINELDDDAAAAMASFEIEELFDGRGDDRVKIGELKKLKAWDKNSALEKAMKYHGLFERDNSQVKPVTIVVSGDDVVVL